MSCGLARMAPAAAQPRHPPSDGAHRLAWWLAARDGGREQLERGALISAQTVNRLLSGEVEPAEDVAIALAWETDGAVLPEDWLRGGSLGWLDRPMARPG